MQNNSSNTYKIWLFCLIILSFNLPANACKNTEQLATTKITYIADGDTITLKNHKKVRFLGINTPEIKHKPNEQDEPYGQEATAKLKQIIGKNKTVKLLAGKDKKDRYGRLLSWVFTTDGKLIAEAMLKQGLAYHIVYFADDRFSNCLHKAESYARNNKIGVWSQPAIKISNKLPTGFGLLQGKALALNQSKYAFWLNMAGNLVLKFSRKEWKNHRSFINGLVGKNLEIKGWVIKRRKPSNRYKNYIINVTHPRMIRTL